MTGSPTEASLTPYAALAMFCEDCVNSLFAICGSCDDLVNSNYVNEWYGDNYCDSCISEFTFHCDNCGNRADNDDGFWCEDSETQFCDSECHDGDCDHASDSLHEYGYLPDLRFRGDGPRFYGVEVEIDGGESQGDVAEALSALSDDESLFWLTSDSSLDNGVEITTQPANIDFMLENMPWEKITAAAKNHGFKSHDTTTCGLHVHVSRLGLGKTRERQEVVLSNLIVFHWLFWGKLIKLARRNRTSWAEPNIEEDETDLDGGRKVEEAKRKGRLSAINNTNYDTIEFRMFRGSLNVSTIKATVQLVDAMVRFSDDMPYAKMLQTDWETFVAFVKSIGHTELLHYIEARIS